MSLTLDKLKALRRQAGAVPAESGPGPGPGASAGAAASPGKPAPDAAAHPRPDIADEAGRIGHAAACAPTVAATAATSATPPHHPARSTGPAPRMAPSSPDRATYPTAADVIASTPAPARHPDPPPDGTTATGNRSVFDWISPAANDSARRGLQPQDVGALRRLLATRERRPTPVGTGTGTGVRPVRRGTALDRSLPGEEIAPGLWKTEAFLPQPIPRAALPLAFAKRPDEAVDPRALLFFDTETTGLAGGTGTRAFMVGAADWHVATDGREGLRVRQLTLATLAAETAMLREFAAWLGPRTVLSSYNGRCYDAPLLKTRYRLARLVEPLSALDHVDLLFPSRRHWRGRWENCRLATIERQVLGIVREDDLPGSEAPAAWLGFLRGGSAVDVRRVAAHNHQDVVTLARLFLRLVEAEAATSA